MNFATEAIVHCQPQTDSHQVLGGLANVAREWFRFFDPIEIVPPINTSEIIRRANILQMARESTNHLNVA
jgi:hypothetical protein